MEPSTLAASPLMTFVSFWMSSNRSTVCSLESVMPKAVDTADAMATAAKRERDFGFMKQKAARGPLDVIFSGCDLVRHFLEVGELVEVHETVDIVAIGGDHPDVGHVLV